VNATRLNGMFLVRSSCVALWRMSRAAGPIKVAFEGFEPLPRPRGHQKAKRKGKKISWKGRGYLERSNAVGKNSFINENNPHLEAYSPNSSPTKPQIKSRESWIGFRIAKVPPSNSISPPAPSTNLQPVSKMPCGGGRLTDRATSCFEKSTETATQKSSSKTGETEITPVYNVLTPSRSEICVLEIFRSSDDNSKIECRLLMSSLKDASWYAALSYVWGDASIMENIVVNGMSSLSLQILPQPCEVLDVLHA
jgi:hypothetical protein